MTSIKIVGTLAIGLIALASSNGSALANHTELYPKALTKINSIKKIYPSLHKKEIERAKPSWEHLRRAARAEWRRTHPNSDAAIYTYFERTGNTKGTVHKVYVQLETPLWKQNLYDCIFKHESEFRFNVWFGQSRGWQSGRFVGTKTVNGVAQLRPFWASWWLRDCVSCSGNPKYDRVTSRTYHITSDPVVSTKIALRIGLGPFYADRKVCGF